LTITTLPAATLRLHALINSCSFGRQSASPVAPQILPHELQPSLGDDRPDQLVSRMIAYTAQVTAE
jgi:hypothetical protein